MKEYIKEKIITFINNSDSRKVKEEISNNIDYLTSEIDIHLNPYLVKEIKILSVDIENKEIYLFIITMTRGFKLKVRY